MVDRIFRICRDWLKFFFILIGCMVTAVYLLFREEIIINLPPEMLGSCTCEIIKTIDITICIVIIGSVFLSIIKDLIKTREEGKKEK